MYKLNQVLLTEWKWIEAMAGWRAVVMLVVMVGLVTGLDREITVHVEAGKEECFFETVKVGNTLTVEYQVIDGGASQLAELDINFRLVSPRGTPILAEFKKSDGVHSHKAEVSYFVLK